jgi:hypothetical protein
MAIDFLCAVSARESMRLSKFVSQSNDDVAPLQAHEGNAVIPSSVQRLKGKPCLMLVSAHVVKK